MTHRAAVNFSEEFRIQIQLFRIPNSYINQFFNQLKEFRISIGLFGNSQ